mmetsp:Transcript_34427/g.67313  ORF Transcript_34427/g.67313 Transcript_34427/m.67313 type:complete len:280 (-) Transcript_34427:116-955(-)
MHLCPKLLLKLQHRRMIRQIRRGHYPDGAELLRSVERVENVLEVPEGGAHVGKLKPLIAEMDHDVVGPQSRGCIRDIALARGKQAQRKGSEVLVKEVVLQVLVVAAVKAGCQLLSVPHRGVPHVGEVLDVERRVPRPPQHVEEDKAPLVDVSGGACEEVLKHVVTHPPRKLNVDRRLGLVVPVVAAVPYNGAVHRLHVPPLMLGRHRRGLGPRHAAHAYVKPLQQPLVGPPVQVVVAQPRRALKLHRAGAQGEARCELFARRRDVEGSQLGKTFLHASH